MSVVNAYELNGRTLKTNIKSLIEAGLVPFIKGQPGAGKSQIVKSIAEEYNLELIDLRLSGYEPVDLSGTPFRNGEKTSFLPTDLIPIEGDEVPKGKDGFLLFLDEFNHAHHSMIRAAYKIVLDRMVGQRKMHENVVVMLAGNRSDDNALTNTVGSALNSRVSHLYLGVNHEQWMEDVAIARNFDKRIIGFLNAFPDRLNDFDPNNDAQEEHSFCSPRTWDFMNELIHDKTDLKDIEAAVIGTISSGIGFEFLQFCEVYKDLVTMQDIINDPHNCNVPTDSATRWAISTMVVQNVQSSNIDPVLEYLYRFPIDNQIIFLKSLMIQDPALSNSKEVISYKSKLSKYLRA